MDSTAELAMAIVNCPDVGSCASVHKKSGSIANGGGIYVVRELVYAYAMWISPQFHLKVIRAYDRLATQGGACGFDSPSRDTENTAKSWGYFL